VRQATDRRRLERRHVRQQRQAEDALWQRLWHQQHPPRSSVPALVRPQSALPPDAWRTIRQHRRAPLCLRATEDQAWRAARQGLHDQIAPATGGRSWIAIRVLTDNCTRRCYGLPLFTAGAAVTAEPVGEALRQLLPPALQFLITDRGTHFTANVFAQ
jgi:hypothetical protein